MRLKKIIQQFILLAVLLMPLTRLGAFEVGFTLKLSQILFTSAFALAVVKRLWERDFSWRGTSLDIPLLLFWLIALISLTQAINLERGILVWLWLSFSIFGIYFLLVDQLIDRKFFKEVLGTFLIASLLVSLFGLYQFFGDFLDLPVGLKESYIKERLGYPRVQSTMLEPLYFANYLLFPIGVLAAFFVFGRNILGWSRRKTGVVLTVELLAIWLTFSRGGWGGMVFLTAALSAIWFYTKLKNYVGWSKIISLGVLMGITLALTPVAIRGGQLLEKVTLPDQLAQISERETQKKERQRQKVTTPAPTATAAPTSVASGGTGKISPTPTSKQQEENVAFKFIEDRIFSRMAVGKRTEARRAAWKFFKRSPILGIGIGNFGPYKGNRPEGISEFDVVNNQLLEVLVETGIVGALAYLTINLIFAFKLWHGIQIAVAKDKKEWLALFAGLLAAFVGIWAQWMFMSGLNVMYYWLMLGLGISGINLMKEEL